MSAHTRSCRPMRRGRSRVGAERLEPMSSSPCPPGYFFTSAGYRLQFWPRGVGSTACPSPHGSAQLDLTACDPYGARRVGQARRGGVALWCRAIPCGGGPPPKACTSCAGCACAWSCAATHGTVSRACWCRRANSATFHRPWSPYATGTGPLRRPRPLGRHDERQRPEHCGASACCWYV